jgi:chemotaxis protein MotA
MGNEASKRKERKGDPPMTFVGMAVVVLAVLGGYLMEHGKLGVLVQPAEFVIILGAAAGSMLVGTPSAVLKQVAGSFGKAFGAGSSRKSSYIELFTMLHEVFRTARKDGLLFLEQHVNNPEKSSVFSKYPGFMKNHHARAFLIDTLKVMLVGVEPSEVEELLDADLEAHHDEGQRPITAINKVGDALPGLGIVAAVLGIVITMQAIDGPPSEIGHKVGAALVGTFLGVLACYGFIGPLATRIEMANMDESRYLNCIKAAVLAFAKDAQPAVAIEMARRLTFSHVRPEYEELNRALRAKR